MSDMKTVDKERINEEYEKMQIAIEKWVAGCGLTPEPMKRAINTFESASNEDEVVKRRSMSTIKGDYKIMLNLVQIGVIDRVYDAIDEEGNLRVDFNLEMQKYDLKKAAKEDLIPDLTEKKDKEGKVIAVEALHFPKLFESRGSKLVDTETEVVIAEIVKARTDMAALIEENSDELVLTNDEVSELNSDSWYDYEKEEVIKKIEKSDLDRINMLVMKLQKYHQVIEAWAKTLVLETKPLKSVTPDNHDLSFGSIHEILSQNSPVSKLREYRRAFGEKFDSKNNKGVLNARHKVKWTGKLEDAPVINYTPVKRSKKGESKQ